MPLHLTFLSWTFTLALGLGGPPCASPPAGPDPGVIEVPFLFEPERGAMVVQLRAGRRTAEVLLDTGAARTVLSAEFAGLPASRISAARFSSDRPGVSGDGVWMRTALALGGRDLGQYPVRLMDLSEVSRVYKRRVDGLLGQDVLTRFETIEIDFRARRLTLVPASSADPSRPGRLSK